MAATGARQLHGREPAIEHQHDTPLGEPAAYLEDHLLHASDRRLVCPPPRRRCGPTQDGQEGQRLDPLVPGEWDEDHHRDPLQSEALDHHLPRGPDGIAVAALGLDLAAVAPLDGVVGHQDDGPIRRDEGQDNQAEQEATGGAGAPGGAD